MGGSEYWLMSLRGEGTRYVPVGNIFSGLFCPVHEDTYVNPEVIRRPDIPGLRESPKKSNTDAEVMSNALQARRAQLKSAIKDIRPHDISSEDSARLVIIGQPLFEWALDDSALVKSSMEPVTIAKPGNPGNT